MSCIYCNGSGETTIDTYCRCSIGAAMRMRANRAVLSTDIEDRTESIRASGPFPDDDLTHPTMAERLRSIGYREPVLPAPAHTCRAGCGALVSACGAQCVSCTTKEAKAKLEFKREDWRITCASLVGLVVGIACTLLIVWGFK